MQGPPTTPESIPFYMHLPVRRKKRESSSPILTGRCPSRCLLSTTTNSSSSAIFHTPFPKNWRAIVLIRNNPLWVQPLMRYFPQSPSQGTHPHLKNNANG